MISILRPSLVYKVNREVADHDDEIDATEWSYEGINVWRGSLDVTFRDYEIDVFWLYNDSSECIGLAEHDSADHSIHKALFYKESSFGTLFQEEWKQSGTLWSMLSPQAYQDFLESSIDEIVLAGNGRIVTSSILLSNPEVYECSKCKKRSFTEFQCKDIKKKPFGPILNPIFIDDSYVVYIPPTNSSVWSMIRADASSQKQPLNHETSQEYPDGSALQSQAEPDLLQTHHLQESDGQQLPPP
jgi:hypothetical protein